MKKRWMTIVWMMAMVVALALPARAADGANAVKLEKEAIGLIQDIEEVARDVQYHAERLNLFMASSVDVSRWTHYHHLDTIKVLVNDQLRPALLRLNEIEVALPEWKQASVDKMVAAAAELAQDASSAFVSKRSSASTIPALNAEYRTLVADMVAHSTSLAKTADAAHSYATAHLKATEAGLLASR